jgi:predicted Rossmann fold nucleotide-binding protein DprA/Smf involved in DNA uptake
MVVHQKKKLVIEYRIGEYKMEARNGEVTRVGIVGSRRYTNRRKIKDFVFLCKEQFGSDLEIVSGGCRDGADAYAKKAALELEIRYVEFPPAHEPYNSHCHLPAYRYGKPYHVGNYFQRNRQIAEYSDVVVAFIPNDGNGSKGTMSTINHAKKLNKPTTIID